MMAIMAIKSKSKDAGSAVRRMTKGAGGFEPRKKAEVTECTEKGRSGKHPQ